MLDATSRREFASGQRVWLRYVRQDCDVQSREFLGGSEAPVEAGFCLVDLTRSRVKEAEGMVALYCQGRIRTGPARRCPRQ